MAKRLICIIISVLMIVSLLPSAAYATTSYEDDVVGGDTTGGDTSGGETTTTTADDGVASVTSGVNTTYYGDLSSAFSAATTSGDTVQLLKNVELSSNITIQSSANVTLDLNGCTVSYPNNGDYGSVFYVNGSLTITDNSEDGTGTITTSGNNEFYAIFVNSSGSLTINKGTITSSNSDGNRGACGIKAQNSSTVVVSGGSISGTMCGLYAVHKSSVTINGGTIKSDTDECYGVYLKGNTTDERVTLIVNGGDISGCTGLYGQCANITINSGTISGGRLYGISVYTDCTVAVNGGTISSGTSTDTYSSAIYIRNDSTVSVSAGSIIGQKYGICMVGSSQLTLSGGSITGVTHGVFVYTSNATITVPASSTVTVKGTGTSALALKVSGSYTPKISIAGGHYSSVVSEDNCADGYEPYTEADTTSYYTNGVPYTVKSTSSTPELYGKSLVIGTQIGVVYYYELDSTIAENYADYSVLFTVGGTAQSEQITLSPKVVGDTTYYVATCYVSFYQMGQSITATVYKGDDAIDSTTNTGYSVRKYYVNKYSTAADTDTTKALLVAMLNYGSYGQTYIEDTTNTLANADLNISGAIDSVSASDLSSYASTSETSEGYSGSYKVYGSVIINTSDSVKLKFTFENVDDCTITINGTDVTPTDGAFTTEDIYVQSWDSFVTIKISGTSGDMTVKFSVLSYAYSMINAYETDSENVTADNTENLRNLLKAMYLYNDAADIYLGNKTVSE